MEKLEFKDRIVSKLPYVGGEPLPGTLLETIYRSQTAETLFATYKGGKLTYEKSFAMGANRSLVPYSPQNSLIRNRIVLFPSSADEYGSKRELVASIKSFINRYVTVTPLFETIAVHYILLTWI